ncbi:hypothetical protein RTM1035_16292 [Roseovarius sp. TM1035]|jgi:hypothetical protein|nr:Hypothetical protein RAK1035_0676 [Roseovarius sp. AK1035]EDM33561.1 hypothetical protein RTM1035_16292 [Roseovarius sp. TM1035]
MAFFGGNVQALFRRNAAMPLQQGADGAVNALFIFVSA